MTVYRYVASHVGSGYWRVFDRQNADTQSRAYNRPQAEALSDWLNERAAGYLADWRT